MFEGRGHDVLGQAVQPVRQLATSGWPARGEPLVAPPTQQQCFGAKGLVERELVELWAVPDQADPAADPEAFITGRVLDDSVERDVVAHDDLSHFRISFRSRCLLRPREWPSWAVLPSWLMRRPPRRTLSGEFRAGATSLVVMRVKGRVGARMRA